MRPSSRRAPGPRAAHAPPTIPSPRVLTDRASRARTRRGRSLNLSVMARSRPCETQALQSVDVTSSLRDDQFRRPTVRPPRSRLALPTDARAHHRCLGKDTRPSSARQDILVDFRVFSFQSPNTAKSRRSTAPIRPRHAAEHPRYARSPVESPKPSPPPAVHEATAPFATPTTPASAAPPTPRRSAAAPP